MRFTGGVRQTRPSCLEYDRSPAHSQTLKTLSRTQRVAVILALAAVYFTAGKLGLRLASVHPSISAVWPASGIALAVFLMLGTWTWPAVYLGAFLVNLTTGGGLIPSLFIATGDTWEGLLAAYFVTRFAGGREAFDHPKDVMRYTVLAALLSPMIAASVGATTLAASGQASWSGYGTLWVTWWLGDAGGLFVVAPLVLLWNANYGIAWDVHRWVEAGALAVVTLLAAEIVFGRLFPTSTIDYPLSFLPMPVFIWAAFRFGRRGAAGSVALVYAVAVMGTLHGYGPFAHFPRDAALLFLQVFICISAVTALVLAAVVLERRKVEGQLRQLAVSDPLTGLANYGHLIDVLEAEAQRSRRTERPFAVLFLDMDMLKKVNDAYGHLVGSRALWRISEAVRKSCRAIDTAARYGGDEFAVVLPESDEEAARQVEGRIKEALAADAELPRISCSTGVACFPKDGETAEALLTAADRMLYGAKSLARTSGETAAT
jgi:diguanylate cyclase (GGDEF)-like protein